MNSIKIFGATAMLAFAAMTTQAQLNVDIYSGHSDSGGGTPFSGLVGSFNSPDIMFGTDTGFNWHPFGLGDFGADITGNINVAGGTYPISLYSDDGAILYIDGLATISRPGPHAPDFTSGSVTLTPGVHSVEVQFFECCGGPSGVDVVLPANVNFSIPDAASTLGLLGGAFAVLAGLKRRISK